jgi:hypothetical protein
MPATPRKTYEKPVLVKRDTLPIVAAVQLSPGGDQT